MANSVANSIGKSVGLSLALGLLLVMSQLLSLLLSPLPAAADEGVARHHAYLARMVTEGVVPAEVSAKARRVWELARRGVPNLQVPAAAAYDGGPMHYTWDNGRVQVTAEMPVSRVSLNASISAPPPRRSTRRVCRSSSRRGSEDSQSNAMSRGLSCAGLSRAAVKLRAINSKP